MLAARGEHTSMVRGGQAAALTGCGQPVSSTPLGYWAVGKSQRSTASWRKGGGHSRAGRRHCCPAAKPHITDRPSTKTITAQTWVMLPVLDEGQHRDPGQSDGSKTRGKLKAL